MLQKFDSRNRDLIVNINGRLLHRNQAGVSPFDSVVQGGDAVWEGLRLYQGRIFKLHEHLRRLRDSAVALAFAETPPDEKIIEEVRRTLAANGMRDGVHIRLTLTRGVKYTSGMDPRLNTAGPTLIVLAEHKPPVYDQGGIRLITSAIRRFPPDCLDPKIHHANLLQSILAKIQANQAGADDALMLDLRGFVAETNATNVFLVRGKGSGDRGAGIGKAGDAGAPQGATQEHRREGDATQARRQDAGACVAVDAVVHTPRTVACPEGITRATVLDLCRENAIECAETDLSLTDVYRADEVFCTGTMGELAPVVEVDGRRIGDGRPGPVTQHLTTLFRALTQREGTVVVE